MLLDILYVVATIFFVVGTVLLVTLIYYLWRLERFVMEIYDLGGRQIYDFVTSNQLGMALNASKIVGGFLGNFIRGLTRKKV